MINIIITAVCHILGFPDGSAVKNPPECRRHRRHRFDPLGQEDPLEVEMATNSSILAWKIPWTEDPDRLKFMGLQRIGHG